VYTYPPCGRGNSREAVTSGWQRGVRHAGERVAAWTRLVTAHRVGRAVTLLHLRWAPGRRPWASCSGAALFLFVVEADRSWELLGWMSLLGSGQGSGGVAVAAGGPESCALPAARPLPAYSAVATAWLSGGGARPRSGTHGPGKGLHGGTQGSPGAVAGRHQASLSPPAAPLTSLVGGLGVAGAVPPCPRNAGNSYARAGELCPS
jgi:hypothetical protein